MLIANRYLHAGTAMSGGMASVLRCTDEVLQRPVAIKVMPGAANARRLRDEISALLKMRSKHVVQVYDLIPIGFNDLGIVQEFIEGIDLFHKAALPKDALSYVRLLWQVASGISDIHAVGVIHRDIKPNNMKIDQEGVVKIFDFGLARETGIDASTTGFVGTIGFAAPELHEAAPAFTPSVDVYALGATALYLGVPTLFLAAVSSGASHVSSSLFQRIPYAMPSEVIGILQGCLERKPEDRPSAATVRDILSKCLLYDRHKALVVYQGQASYLDAKNRSVNLVLPSMGAATIHYDGFSFVATSVSGDVFVNNKRFSVGDSLPGSCVVTLGAPEHGNSRRYITFDLSHPEIVV
jgi:serine/threonine protein kinase